MFVSYQVTASSLSQSECLILLQWRSKLLWSRWSDPQCGHALWGELSRRTKQSGARTGRSRSAAVTVARSAAWTAERIWVTRRVVRTQHVSVMTHCRGSCTGVADPAQALAPSTSASRPVQHISLVSRSLSTCHLLSIWLSQDSRLYTVCDTCLTSESDVTVPYCRSASGNNSRYSCPLCSYRTKNNYNSQKFIYYF